MMSRDIKSQHTGFRGRSRFWLHFLSVLSDAENGAPNLETVSKVLDTLDMKFSIAID